MSSPSRFPGLLLAGSVALAVAAGCTQRPEVSNTAGTSGAGGSRGGTSGGSSAGGSSGGNTGGSSTGGSSGGQDAFVLPDVPPGTGGSAGTGDAGQGEARVCGFENFKLEKTPPDLMLVLDRSSSMNQMVPGAPMGATLWTETLAAVDAVVMGTQMGVNWGLKLFPLPTGCMTSMGAEVPVAASNYMAVLDRARMEGTNMIGGGLSGGTPTDTAVIGATSYLTSLVATRKNPKYILLATDGEPTCTNGVNQGGTTAAIQAITAAANAGFKVYVIGLAIGSSGTNVLNMMADAGGVPRNDPMTRFYPVANRMDLVTALTAITGQVTNCVFPLSKAPPSPNDVKVTVDGMKVEQNMMNGWSYTANNMAIQFNGAICEQIKMGTAQVNIVFGCPGVVIP
jgi:hypothetical protein